MDETASKDWKILLGTTTNAPPEPSLFDRVSLEIKKTDSTTAKTIAEPYIVASVNFYRTAIIKYMNSDAFAPSATFDWNEINRLVQEDSK